MIHHTSAWIPTCLCLTLQSVCRFQVRLVFTAEALLFPPRTLTHFVANKRLALPLAKEHMMMEAVGRTRLHRLLPARPLVCKQSCCPVWTEWSFIYTEVSNSSSIVWTMDGLRTAGPEHAAGTCRHILARYTTRFISEMRLFADDNTGSLLIDSPACAWTCPPVYLHATVPLIFQSPIKDVWAVVCKCHIPFSITRRSYKYPNSEQHLQAAWWPCELSLA